VKKKVYIDLPTAYRLHFHFRFQTKNKQPLFRQTHFEAIRALLEEICNHHQYHLLDARPEPHQLRCLLSLRPNQAPSKVMQTIKANLSRELSRTLIEFESISDLWQRGFFAETVGKIDRRAVERYVETQDAHHGYASRHWSPVVKFKASAEEHGRFHSLHTWGRLYYHVVLATQYRREWFDRTAGERLVGYFRKVADRKGYLLWRASVLPDHVHLLLRLPPQMSIGEVVENLMNNSYYFLTPEISVEIKDLSLFEVWQPSYYAGTIGGPTTAQVKSFLRR
jgi:putative transposase